MGGHGGLNILPQKRWNVYNFDNREKVRRDEEAAAREEQLKREQARKRDAEFRLERLRAARGLPPLGKSEVPSGEQSNPVTDSNHINLFDGIKLFDLQELDKGNCEDEKKKNKSKKLKMEEPRVITPEDEKYRLGYGVVGKGVNAPWYTRKPREENDAGRDEEEDVHIGGKMKTPQKTIEELREERFRRENREKQRQQALVMEMAKRTKNPSIRRRPR